MHDQSLPHFVGVDIGTSTVRCVVGIPDHAEPTKSSVIGYGKATNNGMRKGTVVYADDVAEAIAQAITEAERLSGIKIHRATVNINGTNVAGINSKGVVAISAANREISEKDRLRVEEAAAIVQLPPNREIVQVFAKSYRLDGQDNIKDPIGMQGVRLEVDTHIVTASIPNLKNLDIALEKAQLIPNRHTVSGLAAAEAVLTRQQKESGTALLDIGAGTTNLIIMEDGEVQHVAVLPIGGIHITNDLAIGLKTDLDIAEKVKLEHASLMENKKKDTIKVVLDNKEHVFQTKDVFMVTEARVEELMDYVEKELRRIQRYRKLPGGIVLVGGTAKLPGIADFTKENLQLSTHVGHLQNVSGLSDKIADPAMSTAVGLMLLDMLLLPVGAETHISSRPNTKIFNSLARLVHVVWK